MRHGNTDLLQSMYANRDPLAISSEIFLFSERTEMAELRLHVRLL